MLSADGDYADYLHGRSMHDRLWVPGWEHRDQAMLTTIATWLGSKIYVSRCGVFCVTWFVFENILRKIDIGCVMDGGSVYISSIFHARIKDLGSKT